MAKKKKHVKVREAEVVHAESDEEVAAGGMVDDGDAMAQEEGGEGDRDR